LRNVPASIREPLRHVLLERQEQRFPWDRARPASVLIPLVERDGEVFVWLIKRTDTMSSHRGQIAFPGGKRDPDDRSSMVTAVRETHEELGFSPDLLEVHGRLDDVPTTTGFVITPWVAWLKEDVAPTPNEAEIARAFAVPLAAFVWEKPRPQFFRGKGLTRIVPSWFVDGEIVWGATGRIMGTFAALVRDVMHRHRF
jgi:8-oxo-dGTP pyrophosphatase MutT (NUDIX family)